MVAINCQKQSEEYVAKVLGEGEHRLQLHTGPSTIVEVRDFFCDEDGQHDCEVNVIDPDADGIRMEDIEEHLRRRVGAPAIPKVVPVSLYNNVTLDPEFHRLVCPSPDDVETLRRDDATQREYRERQQIRKEMLAAQLKTQATVPQFEVWRDGERLVLIDGQDCQYEVAVGLGFPITVVERTFENRDDALSHLVKAVLLNQGKSHYTTFYRIVLASHDPRIINLRQQAKDNQGWRTDPLARRAKGLSIRKEIVALADCGETMVRWARELEGQGEMYLGKERWADMRISLVHGSMSIIVAHRRLVAERKSRVEMAQDETAEPKDGKSAKKSGRKGLPKFPMRMKPKIDLKFDNPDLTQKHENLIFCGDAAKVMEMLPDDTHAGLVFGSIHYNIKGVMYDGKDFSKPHQQWLDEDLAPVVPQAARVLREGGRLVLNVADTTIEDAWGTARRSIHTDVVNLVHRLNVGFRHYDTKVWMKFAKPFKNPIGSRSPLNPLGHCTAEWIIVFSLRSHRLEPPTPDTPTGITLDFAREWSGSVWYIGPASHNAADHPCAFPETLAKRVIGLYSWPGDLVIDPWVGTGTTTAVAAGLQRRWLGIDISDHYCHMAQWRTFKSHQKWRRQVERLRAMGEKKTVQDE